MMCKINKSEIPGGPLSFFQALFGRCTAFYGHFLVNVVTSEQSTRISSSRRISKRDRKVKVKNFPGATIDDMCDYIKSLLKNVLII